MGLRKVPSKDHSPGEAKFIEKASLKGVNDSRAAPPLHVDHKERERSSFCVRKGTRGGMFLPETAGVVLERRVLRWLNNSNVGSSRSRIHSNSAGGRRAPSSRSSSSSSRSSNRRDSNRNS